MRRALPLLPALLIAFLPSTPSAAGGRPAPEEHALEVVLRSAPFRLVETRDGQAIEMEDFDALKVPGWPLLPEREFLVLLPPGARARGVLVLASDSEPLPGVHSIAPAPPMLPLAGPGDTSRLLRAATERWQEERNAAYTGDGPWPAETARLSGSGSLRKYAFARVAFRPFTYHPATGRLVHHRSTRVRVVFTLPEDEGPEAMRATGLLQDTLADGKIQGLFLNHEEMIGRYAAAQSAPHRPAGPAAVHDYVIVTTADLADAIRASSFPAWKETLGFHLRIVLTTDPEIRYQRGRDLGEKIRNFLRDHYAEWGIEYVLLVGLDDVPMRLCYPDPSNHVHDPMDTGITAGSIPTDAYYADLSLPDDESWDLDGDGFYGEFGEDNPDFLPEVYVGRIPTASGPRVRYTLDKLVRVERDCGAWKRAALHGGAILFFENQNHTGIPLRDGAVVLDRIERDVMSGWAVSRYSEQAGMETSVFDWPAITQAAFLDDWRTGAYGIVNWAGHGTPHGAWRMVWTEDNGDGIPVTDGSDSFWYQAFIGDWLDVDDDHPSIVFAVSCNVGYPEPNPDGNLGVRLLTDPTLGAASGVVSASRYASVSGDWPTVPGGAESICHEFNRHLLGDHGGPRRLGEALLDAKGFCHLNYAWEYNFEYRNLFDYNLYGDPAMDWRGAGHMADLLRNADLTALEPASPTLESLLPLDPARDLHIPSFLSGGVDPVPTPGAPLVFYSIDAPATILVGKMAEGEIRIDF